MKHSVVTYIFFLSMILLPASAAGEEKKDGPAYGKDWRIGVRGCADFSRLSGSRVHAAGWGAGVAFSAPVPVRGMTVQPELNYVSKAVGVGFIEIPAYLQAGLDLVIFRPFIMAGPYVGYAVYKEDSSVSWDDINRFQAGLSVGGGFDIWRFQLNARYSWNLTNYRRESSSPKISGAEVALLFFF